MTAALAVGLAVALVGQVLYHLSQKSLPTGAHPVMSLLVFYAVAIVASLPLFALFPLERPIAEEWSRVGWAAVAVGLAIVLIELGFLLAYRAGGELSTSFVLTSATVAASLLLLGILFFGERLTAVRLTGLAFAVGGVMLLARK